MLKTDFNGKVAVVTAAAKLPGREIAKALSENGAKVAVCDKDIEAAKALAGVTAEFTGVVSEVAIEEGAYIAEGTRLFTIKNHKKLRAVVEVTSHEMSQIAKGQSASIEVGGQLYEGEVTKIRMETVTDACTLEEKL